MHYEQTELQKQRAAWFADHLKPGMSRAEVWQLNEELHRLLPLTREELKQRAKEIVDVEFVL